MTNKKCNVCLEEKPVSEFHTRVVGGKYYPRTKCKLCDRAKYVEWLANNKDKANKTRREWRANNKEKVRKYHSDYYRNKCKK